MAGKHTCAIHFEDDTVKNTTLIAFSDVTKRTALEKCHLWIDLPCKESKIALNFIKLINSHASDPEFRSKSTSRSNDNSLAANDVECKLHYHQHCYTKLTLLKRIEQAKKRKEESESQGQCEPKKRLRSANSVVCAPKARVPHLFPDVCVICTKTVKWMVGREGIRTRDSLVVCQSDGSALQNAALHRNAEHVLRYVQDQDPAAMEVKYHKSCYRAFTRLDVPIECSETKDTSTLHKSSQDSQDLEEDTTDGSDFGDSESEHIDHKKCTWSTGSGIDQHDIASTLYKGALALKNIIKNSPRQNISWPPTGEDFSPSALKSFVPSLLFNFLAWTCDLTDDDFQTNTVRLKKNALECEQKIYSVSHDLLGLAYKDVSPKQLMLGVTARHITGSKRIVDILCGLGHGASYTTVIEHDTALAENCTQTSVLGIPSGFNKSSPTTLVWDNNDFCEETLSGKGTTHCTTGIIIQTQSAEKHEDNEFQMPAKIARTYRKNLVPPKEDIIPFKNKRKQEPAIHICNNHEGDSRVTDISCSFDLSYYMCKEIGPSSLPGWTGFNEKIHNQPQSHVSQIGYLPIIDASPTEMNTVNTILHRSVKIADELQLATIVVVMDQALYSKAQEIRWVDEYLCKRLVLCLGPFHTSMCFLGVLGKRFRDAGLEDLMVESGVVAPGSINSVMSGHHYNRAVRAHKLVAEALGRLLWEEFLGSLDQARRACIEERARGLVNVFIADPSSFEESVMSSDIQALLAEMNQFMETRSCQNPTFQFWVSYINYVCLLQQFLRATKTGNWYLHLQSVKQIIPLLFAYDRINYARYLPCYLAEMESLKNTHPDVEQRLKNGGFSVQRQSENGFSQTACDQVIEQTINRHSKTQGGLIGKTKKRGAVHRWILSCHIRGEITSSCENIANKNKSQGQGAVTKHLKPSSIASHEEQVGCVMSTVHEMINPFQLTDARLINISSGVVPNVNVEEDLLKAYEKGEKAYSSFKEERLEQREKSLYAPMKRLKLATFSETGQTTKKTNVKGDNFALNTGKFLLTRILHLGKVDNINVKDTLAHSLVSVPPCLGHHDGSLVKTNKAKLLQVFDDARTTEDLSPGGALLVDGMAYIQTIKLRNCQTFEDFSHLLLGSLIFDATQAKSERIDFVMDMYPTVSIKGGERHRRAASRGTATMKIMKGNQQLPKQWNKFLTSGENKTNLTAFLFKDWNQRYHSHLKLYFAHGNMCHMFQEENGTVKVEPVPVRN